MIGRIIACFLAAIPAAAHFQVLVPSTDSVQSAEAREVSFDIRFTHPMARGPVMAMEVPARFGVLVGGQTRDLSASLTAREVAGKAAYSATYTLGEPGAHVFFLEPSPYYEAGERAYIVHYTKVVVDGFNAWSGWDAMVGFPVEIRPLTRPYGLWAGNVFQGVVLKDGAPVPFAHVEVERLNDDAAMPIPAGVFETQVIKADAAGVFTYAMPMAGWWGFAALVDGDTTMTTPEGDEASVELGAVMWVHATALTGHTKGGSDAHP